MTWPAHTAAPFNALRMWSDHRRIYVELPGPAGPGMSLGLGPYITTYPLTEGGLSKALALLQGQCYDFGGEVISGTIKSQTYPESLAESILRRRGVI